MVGQGDGALLETLEEPHDGMRRPDPELGGEELGHALLQVEQHARAQQPREEAGEHQHVGQGVDLHDAVAAAQVAGRDDDRRREEEGRVLRGVPRGPAALAVTQRDPVDVQAPETLASGLARVAQADHVDVEAGVGEGVRGPGHPAVPRHVVLAHHAHPGTSGARRAPHGHCNHGLSCRARWTRAM